MTDTVGRGSPPGRELTVAGPWRAGIPATRTSPANPAAASASPAVAARPRRVSPRAQAQARSSSEPGTGRKRSRSGRAAQTRASAVSTDTLVAYSVVCGAMSSVARSPTDTAYTNRATRPFGIVTGSVIMKKRKIRISGEVTSSHQKLQPEIGPRCQRAVMECPLNASTPIPSANVSQKPPAIRTRRSRDRIARPPTTISAIASASHRDIGPHQKSSGSARPFPRIRKQRTSPKLDGLKMWRPRQRIRCFDRSETAAVAAKIHAPWRLHQSPWGVPGTRRMNATPLPVRSALAGHMITCWRKKAMPTSSTAHVPSATRIWAIDRLNPNAVWPRTCSVTITAARWRRGSRTVGNRTGYCVPRIVSTGRPATAGAPMSAQSYSGP
jgi:hypothetical protein